MQPTRLWFSRHGETTQPQHWFGRTEVPLSDLGRHQAEAMAAYLESAEIDAIVSSPRKRALDTAAPMARQRSMKLDIRAEWSEMDFGQWEGKLWGTIEAEDPVFARQWSADPAATPCPGGESANQFEARTHAALERLLDEFKGRSVFLSGHAGTVRSLLGHTLGLPYMECFRFAVDFGCLNAAAWTEGVGQVALVNFVPGPRSAEGTD